MVEQGGDVFEVLQHVAKQFLKSRLFDAIEIVRHTMREVGQSHRHVDRGECVAKLLREWEHMNLTQQEISIFRYAVASSVCPRAHATIVSYLSSTAADTVSTTGLVKTVTAAIGAYGTKRARADQGGSSAKKQRVETAASRALTGFAAIA